MFLDAVFRGRSQEKKSKSFSEELLKVYVESNTDVYSSRGVFFIDLLRWGQRGGKNELFFSQSKAF